MSVFLKQFIREELKPYALFEVLLVWCGMKSAAFRREIEQQIEQHLCFLSTSAELNVSQKLRPVAANNSTRLLSISVMQMSALRKYEEMYHGEVIYDWGYELHE